MGLGAQQIAAPHRAGRRRHLIAASQAALRRGEQPKSKAASEKGLADLAHASAFDREKAIERCRLTRLLDQYIALAGHPRSRNYPFS